MNDCTYLVYTHSQYKDVLKITLNRLDKYFKTAELTICTNDINSIDPTYIDKFNIKNIYEYDDTLPYSQKVASILKNIKTTYVLFNQDVNILFNHVQLDILNNIITQMSNEDIDVVRLSHAGITNPILVDNPLLKKNTGNYFLSVISAIWRTSSFLTLCNIFKNSDYRNFEVGESQIYAAQLKNYYVSSSKDYKPYYSYYYPCFHSISYGKWIISEYSELITELSTEYSIDLSIRGCS